MDSPSDFQPLKWENKGPEYEPITGPNVPDPPNFPSHLEPLAWKVRRLAERAPMYLKRWRERIREWAKEEHGGRLQHELIEGNEYHLESLPLTCMKLTLPHKYALLAAISDFEIYVLGLRHSEASMPQASDIDPFPGLPCDTKPDLMTDEDLFEHDEDFVLGAVYSAIQQNVKNITEQEVEFFTGLLDDVREDLGIGLGVATENAGQAKTDDEHSASIKRPPENAFKAWRLRDLSGITNQTKIAEELRKQGVPANQGQVSRWLKQVEEYLNAGNVLPPIKPLTSEPQSMDPKILDMSKRQDGCTPRQRPQKSVDSDD